MNPATLEVYRWVIDDVVSNVREMFRAKEKNGEDALNELQQLWESKVMDSGCLLAPEPEQPPPAGEMGAANAPGGSKKGVKRPSDSELPASKFSKPSGLDPTVSAAQRPGRPPASAPAHVTGVPSAAAAAAPALQTMGGQSAASSASSRGGQPFDTTAGIPSGFAPVPAQVLYPMMGAGMPAVPPGMVPAYLPAGSYGSDVSAAPAIPGRAGVGTSMGGFVPAGGPPLPSGRMSMQAYMERMALIRAQWERHQAALHPGPHGRELAPHPPRLATVPIVQIPTTSTAGMRGVAPSIGMQPPARPAIPAGFQPTALSVAALSAQSQAYAADPSSARESRSEHAPPASSAPALRVLPSSSSQRGDRRSAEPKPTTQSNSTVPQFDGAGDGLETTVPEKPRAADTGAAPQSGAGAGGNVVDVEEEEALNSDLDEEEEELVVPDLMLCQFEKVSRSKTKWRAVLKDGVMQIKGRDHLFSQGSGDFQF